MPFIQKSLPFRVDQDGAGGGGGDSQVKVQALSDGSFVFVWRELEDNQADHYRIFVRKFDQGLNPLTSQIKIDGAMTDTAGNGFSTPSIAASNDGRFFVEYDDYGGGTLYSDGSFYADRVWPWLIGFESNGQSFGQITLLGLPNKSDPVQSASTSFSAIAPNGTGGWHSVVVQNFINNPNARYFLVNGQKVDVGLAPGGHFLTINADIADAGDSAFLAWNRGVTDTDSDVYAMIVGQPRFRVNTQTQGYQMLSPNADAIATLGTGIFVVTWSDLSTQDEASDPGEGVRARIFAPNGEPITGEIILPADPAGAETRPMVAALENNYWIAVWVDERGTVGQVFSERGVRTGDEQVLIAGYGGYSSMTVLPGNQLVMSWQERSGSLANQTQAQTWQITFSNNAPYAAPDGPYDGKAGEILSISAAHGVLSNDFDADGNALTASVGTLPVHGSVVVNPDGSFHYTPNPGFAGTDAFLYQVSDGTGNVSSASVTITVRREVKAFDKHVLIDALEPFLNFFGLPADFADTVFEGPFSDILLTFVAPFLGLLDFKIGIGSLELSVDTDKNGSFETLITLEDPVPNVTVTVDSDAEKSVVGFTRLAQATSGADTIAGTPGLDYLGGDAGNDTLRAFAGNDALTGGDGNDALFPGSGTDSVRGDAGDDGIYFGADLEATDRADGGEGNDSLAIQGNYSNLDLAGMSNVEVLLMMSGSDTRFGDIAGNLYDYAVKTADLNIAAGNTLTISATGLLPGEDLSFDGSAETDGNFRIYAGQGTDTLKGGAGSDGFFFGADGNLTGADRVDGGAGTDSLALRGNYVGAGAMVFQDASFTNIEVLALLSGHTNEFSGVIVPGGYDYDVTLADGNVASGQRLDVSATRLGADESLRFDGHLETNGSFWVFGGLGNDNLIGGAKDDSLYGNLGADVLDGGGGNDIYSYRSVAESTAAATDTLKFAAGDRIDLSFIDADGPGGTGNAFNFIGGNAFSNTAGQLRAFEVSAGIWQVQGDTNGDGTADLVINVNTAAPLVAGDFVP
jgi:Ca2+-binding RTX toxin-like protein